VNKRARQSTAPAQDCQVWWEAHASDDVLILQILMNYNDHPDLPACIDAKAAEQSRRALLRPVQNPGYKADPSPSPSQQ
jgi:hypothetical protein